MVRYYGVIPATSVPSESAFSVAGYINRKERSSMAPATLKRSMFVKSYLQLKKDI
jgi:hypothetical protein